MYKKATDATAAPTTSCKGTTQAEDVKIKTMPVTKNTCRNTETPSIAHERATPTTVLGILRLGRKRQTIPGTTTREHDEDKT